MGSRTIKKIILDKSGNDFFYANSPLSTLNSQLFLLSLRKILTFAKLWITQNMINPKLDAVAPLV